MEASKYFSTSQRALACPEILCVIFTFLQGHRSKVKRPWYTKRLRRRRLTLINCASVNYIWCSEAMRLVWIEPTAYTPRGLASIFDWIPASRRQVYADMIVRVTIHTALRTDMIKTYDGVNFHKLHDLTLLIHTPAHSAIWIPRLICPSVKHLSIGSVSGYFQEDKAKAVVMWEYIFNRILELFPTLESLRFLDRVFKDLRILVKLKRDLGLKSLKQKAWEAPTVDAPLLDDEAP